VEQAVDPPYMQACGIDLARMDIWQPDSAEQALEIVLALVPVVPLIVVDSLAALAPRAELEGEMGDSHVGLLPRLLGQFTRKVGPLLRQHGTVLLLVNQLRMRVGVLYGNPETTPGGRAVPYAASTRLDVRREADLDLKEDGRVTSVGARVTARKHKTGAPFGVARVPIKLGAGVDTPREAYLLGREYGVLAMTGNAARFDGALLGVGQAAVLDRLRSDPALTDAVVAATRERALARGPAEEDTESP
jgi:recombination protein RecA